MKKIFIALCLIATICTAGGYGGAAIEAYDAQAQNNGAKYWYPLTLETVVIAVDRDQTDMAIATWGDLAESEIDVSMPDSVPVARLAAAALCYGLEGEGFTLAAAVGLLEPLHAKKLLKFSDGGAPIQICLDSEAAARIKNGENIEIVIASDGTLAYMRGLLSNDPLTLPDNLDEVLLAGGFRLPDGRCDEAIYPEKDRYAPAKVLGDHSRLNGVMQDWTRVLRRDIRHTHLYRSADGREHIILAAAFLVVVVAWISAMMLRVQQKEVRRTIFVSGILLAGWVLNRLIKYQLDEDAINRYFWYAFYFFQACLPLAMLRIASLIGVGSGVKRTSKLFYGLCFVNLVLVALVMTNDLHGLAFAFRQSLAESGWSNNYSYGIVYFAITAVLLVELVGGIILMFAKAKHSPRRFGVIFPLIFTGALIMYIVGYAARVPVVFDSDMTLTFCAFALLFLELCIRAGQIPVNIRYRELFENADMNLQIVDSDGTGVLSQKDTVPLDAKTWGRLKESPVSINADADTLFLKNKIAGGYAVWREDIAAVNGLKAQLDASNRNLAFLNEILSNVARAKEQTAHMETKNELYAMLEKDIAGHEARLAEMLGGAPEDESKRAAHMGTVAVLVCYIKRKCQLLLSEMGGAESIKIRELSAYMEELTDAARLAGIDCLIPRAQNGSIDTRQAILSYDFFGSVLEWSAVNLRGKIITQILPGDGNNGRITMKLLMNPEALAFELPEALAGEINDAGGLFQKEDYEDMAGLLLSFPSFPFFPSFSEGGEPDA